MNFASANFKSVKGRAIWCLIFFCLAGMSALQAQPGAAVNGVTVKDNTAYRLQNGQLDAITNTVSLPCDVEVDTNGTFTVGKGKERKLQEGQVIRDDGWMTSPNGTTEPVYDHIAARAGKVYVVRDGEATVLTQPMTCTNNLQITPDEHATYPNGSYRQLVDGQLFRLDGTPIPPKDAVTLINGQVMVQKSGTLVHLQPVQIMGMADGTRVHGDGKIQERDGQTFQLQEGKTILVDGLRVGF